MAHAFETLTPNSVLDALESVGLRGDGRLTALSSYENRVYLAVLEDGQRVVAKFYRPDRWSQEQIQEEHDFALELMDAEVPVVGPLVIHGATLHRFHDFAFNVSPYRGGRAPDLDEDEVLEWIGRFLGRFHSIGVNRPFSNRIDLNLESYGLEPMRWLLAHQCVPLDVQSLWERTCQDAINTIAGYAILAGPRAINDSKMSDIARLRLHGDCHPGNILWTPTDAPAATGPGPHFVDLDDVCMGPAVQDLWMLTSGERSQRSRQLGALLDGYEQVRSFDRRELALIEPLRTLRIIHYSAWLARRWQDPTFPRNFPWFGSSDYWNGQVQVLQDQIEAMQEDPLIV